MSRRNSREAKAIRRKEREAKPLHISLKAHSFCAECGEYTLVWEPARLCAACLERLR